MDGVSLCMGVFTGRRGGALAFPEMLARMAEVEIRLIELWRGQLAQPDTRRRLADAGVRVWSVHGGLGGGAASLDDAARRDAVEAELPWLEAAAAFAPCPYVVHWHQRCIDPAHDAPWRASVEALLARAEALDVTLAVETVPDKPENERYVPSAEIAAFVRALASPHLRICLDLNHTNLKEELAAAVRGMAGLIATIHVSDNHGEREEHLYPGEGVIDFPPAFSALAETGYPGPVNFECSRDDVPTRENLLTLRGWAEATLAQAHGAW